MDNLFKRILSLVLAVLMVVSYIPTSAFATDGADETPADVEPYDLGEDDTPIDTGYRYAYTEGSEVYDEYVPDDLGCCENMLLNVEFYGATCTHADQILITCEYCEWMRLAQDIPGGEPKWEGHRYTDTVYDPTCQEGGYTEHYCDGCGGKFQDTYVDPVDCSYGEDGLCIWCHTGECKHEGKCDPVEGGEYHAPTCGEDGYQTVKCQDCGKEFVKTLPATGNHDYDLETVYCKNCGFEFTCECDGDTKCTESSKNNNCYVCYLSHENCTVEESTGGDETDPEGTVVAKIGDVEYTTLQAAFDAAAYGDTITLMESVTLAEADFASANAGILVPAGKKITLDLKGQGIAASPAAGKAFAVIINKGNLTITDSSEEANGNVTLDLKAAGSTSYAMNTILNQGTLVIEGGYIQNFADASVASTQIGYAIDNNSTSGVAHLEIKGGNVVASGSNYYDAVRMFCNSMTNTNYVKVTGGDTGSIWMQNPSDGSAGKNTKDVLGEVYIEGGNVAVLSLEPSEGFIASVSGGTVESVSHFQTSEGRDLVNFITGGTITEIAEGMLADGYVHNDDGTVTKYEGPTCTCEYKCEPSYSESSCEICKDHWDSCASTASWGAHYAELLKAGGELTIPRATTLTETVTLEKNLVLDLNTFFLTGPGRDAAIIVPTGITLTIEDDSQMGNVSKIQVQSGGNLIVRNGGASVLVNDGHAVITGGNFYNMNVAPLSGNGTWSISGGLFSCDVTDKLTAGYVQLGNGIVTAKTEETPEVSYTPPVVGFTPPSDENISQETTQTVRQDIMSNPEIEVTSGLDDAKNNDQIEAFKTENNLSENAIVEVKLQISLKDFEAKKVDENDEESAEEVTKLTFDVTPMLVFADKSEKLVVQEEVTFRLPIPSNFAAAFVDVFHYGDDNVAEKIGAALEVQGEGANRYVVVSHDEFSPIEVVATETPEEPTVVEVDTLDELIAALESDSTLPILVTKTIKIPAGETVEIDLNGKTVTSVYQEGSTTKHIYPLDNYGTLTIKDSVGTGSITGRGIYNRDGATITVNGAKIVAQDANGGAGIWGYGSTSKVYLNNATIIGYTGVVSSEGYVEINGGTYTCYSGIADDGTQLTSPTYNIRAYNGLKITDGTFTSRHGVLYLGGGKAEIEGGSYTIEFTAATTSNVVYISDDADVTIKGGEFISDDTNDIADSGAAVLVSGSDAKLTIENGTFVGMNGMVSGNAKTVIKGGSYDTVFDYNHYGNIENFVETGAIIEVGGETYVKTEEGLVANTFVAEVNGKGYKTLAEAVAIGGEVKVLADITLTAPITVSGDVTLDLNGKQITAAFVEGSATNHLYVFTNRGTLTIKDTVGGGVINTRGIYNYGDLTLTSGTINAIDANGGHGVRTYANGTFTMTGGTVAATYEDGDPAVSGNYDATPITIDEGATVSITGGKITNASNYTPAINNAGELVIENVEVKAVFEAVASYGTLTIKGGSYEVTDPIGGHAVWIAAGTANIEGGTFTPDTGKQATSYGVCVSDGTVSITGGIFHANAFGKILYTADDGEIKVSGGTFDVNPKDFVVDGFKPVENADGTYGIQVAKTYVAEVNGKGYETLAEAVAIGGEVKVLTDIALTAPITVSKDVTLDLNGKVISGVNNTGSGALIKVANSGKLTVKDSSAEQTGKITYAQGTSNVGWTVYVEGALVLESGTIELTGDSWSIGYAVDVRPNAWGSNYANPTVFTMNGGKLVSSDGAVRVASTSYDSWSNISASFEMNAGKIEAAGDGVFIQQSNDAYDTLSFTLNGGNIEAAKYPVRVYGPAPTEAEDCMTIALNGGQLVGGNQGTNAALMDGKVYMGGGMTADTLLANGSVTASAAFAQANTMEGYGWKKTGDSYTLMEIVAPNAVVENLGAMTLKSGDYDIFDGSLKESTEDLPLQIALNFKTEDTLEDAKASYYGKWRTDFYLTFNGLADGATEFNVGSSYLAGNYGTYGWIAVPASYMAQTLKTGVEYPVVSGYDSNITYEQICESVKNFTAAIYIDPAILEANPDFTVTLNLKMVNPDDDTDVLTVGEGFTFGFEDLIPPAAPNATVTRMAPMTLTAADKYMVWPSGDATIDRPLQAVVNFQANETEEEIKGTYYEKWLVDFNLEFDGLENGTITADDCYLAGNYGTYGWIVIPTDGLKLEEGVKYPVVSNYDTTLNYKDICKDVKNFTAAIHVAPEILEANPDFTVALTLVMTDPENPNKTLTIGDPIIFTAKDLVTEVINYTFQQSTQLGLIEPWALKSNLYVKNEAGAYLSEDELNAFVDYGAYFVRAKDLGNPTELPTAEMILAAEGAICYSKNDAAHKASVARGTAGYMISTAYVEGIYTYELSEPIYVLYYIEDASGVHYDVVKERNLKSIAEKAQNNTGFDVTERAVYTRLIEMEEAIVAHRATFANIPEVPAFKAPHVVAGQFGEYQTGYTVNHSVNISLIEPWGLKVNGYVDKNAVIEEYGAVVIYDKAGKYTAQPDVATLVNDTDAYVLSSANGDATIEISGNYQKIVAIYNTGIYTYELNDDAYVVFFVKIGGVYHFGDVKTRNIVSIMETAAANTNTAATERAVYTAMINMHNDVTTHRAKFGY